MSLLQKKDIGPEEDDAQFGFLTQLLICLRYIAPGDVKGEIREVKSLTTRYG
jgi:hypothetical protein